MVAEFGVAGTGGTGALVACVAFVLASPSLSFFIIVVFTGSPVVEGITEAEEDAAGEAAAAAATQAARARDGMDEEEAEAGRTGDEEREKDRVGDDRGEEDGDWEPFAPFVATAAALPLTTSPSINTALAGEGEDVAEDDEEDVPPTGCGGEGAGGAVDVGVADAVDCALRATVREWRNVSKGATAAPATATVAAVSTTGADVEAAVASRVALADAMMVRCNGPLCSGWGEDRTWVRGAGSQDRHPQVDSVALRER